MKKLSLLLILSAALLSCKKDKCKQCRSMTYYGTSYDIEYGPYFEYCQSEALPSRSDSVMHNGIMEKAIYQYECNN